MWWVFCSADTALDRADLPPQVFPEDEVAQVAVIQEPRCATVKQTGAASQMTSPTDEREATPKVPSESSKSDDDSPLAAAPSALGLAFSTLFQPDCVQQCAEVAEDDDDSFLAVFDSPQVAGGRSGAVHADPHRPWHHTAEGGDPLATPAVIIPPPPQKKGMVIHVHAPRKSLPTTGYDIQWKVDAPHPSGLVRAQARVMLERHESEYACSETGRSIEFHQDGERLEVARITCIRLKPQQLQRSSNTSWRAQYPAVAQYLSTINPPDTVGSVAASSGVGPPSAARFHALQHLLISDLHVHADYRGGGLGLSLLDHATRRAGDPLAWTVLTLPDALPHPHATQMGSTPPPSPQHVRHYPHDEPSDSDTLQRYFGLLGFAPIHERYMARAIAHRVLLPEASPMAPALGVTDDY